MRSFNRQLLIRIMLTVTSACEAIVNGLHINLTLGYGLWVESINKLL